VWRVDPTLEGLRNLGKYGSFCCALKRQAQKQRASLAAARGGPLKERTQGLLRLLQAVTRDMDKKDVGKLTQAVCPISWLTPLHVRSK
jgi:hypothetical protein